MTIQSILADLKPENIIYAPYPYIAIPDALEPAYYQELAAAFPNLERIAGQKPLANNKVYRLPACEVLADPAIPAIWREFFEYHCSGQFLQECIAFWHTAIEREYPAIEAWFGKPLAQLTSARRHYSSSRPPEHMPENMQADVMMDCQFVVNSPVTSPSTVRGPHLDKPFKLFAGLLYFRHPDDRSTGSDLTIYRFKTQRYYFDRRQHLADRFVEPVADIPYQPNMLILWLNTPRSLHGVTPRSVTPVPRRYINFLAECYTQHVDGFFPLKRNFFGRFHALAKGAIRRRAMRLGQHA